MIRLTKKQIDAIPEMRKMGKTTGEIAMWLGCKPRTVLYWVKRMKDAGMKVPTTVKRGGRKIKLGN